MRTYIFINPKDGTLLYSREGAILAVDARSGKYAIQAMVEGAHPDMKESLRRMFSAREIRVQG